MTTRKVNNIGFALLVIFLYSPSQSLVGVGQSNWLEIKAGVVANFPIFFKKPILPISKPKASRLEPTNHRSQKDFSSFFRRLSHGKMELSSKKVKEPLKPFSNLLNSTDGIKKLFEDHQEIIDDQFQIPKGLKRRTHFWAKVFGKYSDEYRIVHHKDFPWIVYKVVDVLDMKKAGKKKWLRNRELKRRANTVRAEVQENLQSLAKMKNFHRLSSDERRYFSMLKSIPGERSKVFSIASDKIASQLGQKSFFLKGLKTSGKYMKNIEKIFAENDVPTELARIPFIESSFNLKARSSIGADGIWQIMPYIGKKFMKVDKVIDERKSPVKGARVAAFLFKENYKIIKNWPQAVTAYNHGIRGMLQAKREFGSKDFSRIISKYEGPAFGFDSKNFYAEFLAALYIEKYKDQIFENYELDEHQEFTPYIVQQEITVEKLVARLASTKEKFISYNYDLKRALRNDTVVPVGFEIHLPSHYKINTQLGLLSHPESSENEPDKNTRTVAMIN